MAEPLPPDPYLALGISRDADIDTIKKTHRKLVLKHHPDRIKDPALQEEGKNAFTKVQAAYELLVDVDKRSRYDREYEVAELRKSRLMADAIRAFSTPQKSRPSSGQGPVNMSRREPMHDTKYQYEDRTPDSYFDIPRNSGSSIYEEPIPRTNARKVDSIYEHDRRTSGGKTTEKKKEERARPVGLSAHMNVKFREKAAQAKEEVRKAQARTAKARDQEERRDREHKRTQSSHQPAYARDIHSDSDSDTVVSRSRQTRPTPQRASTTRPREYSSPEPPRRRQVSPQPSRWAHDDSEIEDHRDDLWKGRHGQAASYINDSMKRPSMPSRQGSDAYSYIYREAADREESGSEDEKRPSPRSSRRSHKGEDFAPRPSMASANTAPSRLRHMVDEMSGKDAPRFRSSWSYKDTDKRDMDLPQRPRRTPSEPSPPTLPRRETNTRGSTLKTEINHDSGYGSGSNPQSPGLRGDSPPSPPPTRPSLPRETSRVYKVAKQAGDDGGRSRLREVSDAWSNVGAPSPRALRTKRDTSRTRESGDDVRERRRGGSRERGRESGEDRDKRGTRARKSSVDTRIDSRDSGRERRSSREPDSRSRSSKNQQPANDRPSAHRTESSRHDSRRESSKLYGEVTPSRERSSTLRSAHPTNVKTASYNREPTRGQYTPSSYRYTEHEERNSALGIGSRPALPRRGSVY